MNLSDEYYGDAAIGLCQAAENYDESRGCKFSAFATKYIRNQLSMQFRKQRVKETHSLLELKMKPDNKALDFIQNVELLDDVNRIIKNYSDRDKQIILKKLQGYPVVTTCRELGVKKQWGHYVWEKFLKQYARSLGGEV